ncbi:MAG: dihydroorotate dehydrogenase [Polyangiaceae bacterium]|nr:dihydroorotate dehydrogenase [Polyangiaceae bacterium]MCW5790190.1 dihydroorotate dehydrogenase [Polyangiaceae bacterium]
MNQEVTLGGLTLKNPVLTASGTFGYGLEYDSFFDVAELGGICTKGLSLAPRHGNPPERICETPAGMLNAIGLANVGVEYFCEHKLPTLRERGVTVVANIFASSVEDFVKITERLERSPGVAAIELNVSCPNVSQGGIEFGRDPALCAQVTAACKAVTQLPIWVKMSPEAGDIVAVAKACEEAGADAVTAINTIRGMSIDPSTGRVRLANRTGGLSGPALRPIALRIVWDLVGALRIPVIGIGGVFSAEDALQFLLAGASAVQVGTASFSDPTAASKVRQGIAAYCAAHQLTVSELIGRGRPDSRR